MSMSAARFALGCAVLGLVTSSAAAYVHYHLLFDPHYASFCDVNGTVNCSQVYLSRFGTAFGIPVALLGGIWFDSLSANPFGITILPLFAIGFPIWLFRDLLLRELP